jgi:hypothetical protein
MNKIIRRGYNCPRWLYRKVEVPARDEINLPAPHFANESMFKQKLISLSFTAPLATPADPPGPWFRRIHLELGKTGCSDQNLVKGSLAALCATPWPQRQKGGAWNTARDCRLQRPYLLPRDCRLEVKYWNRHPTLTISTYATFVAMGRTDDHEPVILAGEGVETLKPGKGQTIKSADLRNNGRKDVWIDRLIFKDFDWDVVGETGRNESGTWIAWQVNPDVGTQWMPVDQGIPVGNLAPMARPEQLLDRGPRCYLYPADVYSYPKQGLGIKLINESAVDAEIGVCLYSELEVF